MTDISYDSVRILPIGFDTIGLSGKDGIRYAWHVNGYHTLVESASFANKTKGVISDIAGYTTSVGLGCILRHYGMPCVFCRTGNLLPFSTVLTAKEIALQNLFMALHDAYSANGKRRFEFAYMGQGEPGYSYPQVREAIRLTNAAMKLKGLIVYRHIISTSGVGEMLSSLRDDLASGFFDSRVTLHFSLHAGRDRGKVMPIDNLYPFTALIPRLREVANASGEKVCLGFLLFNGFSPKQKDFSYTTRIDDLEAVLAMADAEHFRFSLCEYNDSGDIASSLPFPNDIANEMVFLLKEKGFEAKIFRSYGRKEETACGMLAGKEPSISAPNAWDDLYRECISLLESV